MNEHEIPDRPDVPNRVREYTKRWMSRTSDTEPFRDAVRQVEQDLKDLFPVAKQAKARKRRGGKGKADENTDRSRAEDREVRVAHIFRNSLHTVAITVPDKHSFEFEARPMVPPLDRTQRPIGKDPMLNQFGITATLVADGYLQEISWQARAESWVRRAVNHRAGIVKLRFQRSYHGQPLGSSSLPDSQDNQARLQALQEAFLRGDFSTEDADMEEMRRLAMTVTGGSELRLWQGLVADRVPLEHFRVDPKVRSLEDLCSAGWMEEDHFLTKQQVSERFPFQIKEPAEGQVLPDGEMPWEGVHPRDLESCGVWHQGSQIAGDQLDKWREEQRTDDETFRWQDELVRVMEVWSNDEQMVTWFLDGVDYPIGQWKAERRPARFFPYHVIVMNPWEGTWYGRSDTELQGPIQSRMNRKQSDEEKARWLSLPRGIGNRGSLEEEDILDLPPPGKIKMVRMPNEPLDKNLVWVQMPFVKEAFNTDVDKADLQKMAGSPEQALGLTGEAEFAAEVHVAAAGSSIATNFRKGTVRRALEEFYVAVGEILLQELRRDEVVQMVGEHAVWPEFYDEREAQQALMQVHGEVLTTVREQLQAGMIPDVQQAAQMAQELFEQRKMEVFSGPEPLTREALFKRLRIKVNVSINGRLDDERRLRALTALLQVFERLGLRVNPEPMARLMAGLLGEDDELDNLLELDPVALVQSLAQALQQNPGELDAESAALLAQLGQLAQQLLAAQQQPAGGGGESSGGGAPPPAPMGGPVDIPVPPTAQEESGLESRPSAEPVA